MLLVEGVDQRGTSAFGRKQTTPGYPIRHRLRETADLQVFIGGILEDDNMGFPSSVRTKVLVRSARICCLCFKQCGTNFEIHHIVQEADGGPSTEDNALPVCFDCHAEVGHYNDRHPKGTKFRPPELRARRDALYKLVESGALVAQILVQRLPSAAVRGTSDAIERAVGEANAGRQPAAESREFLDRILDPSNSLDAISSKVKMLGSDDAAWLVDSLVSRTKDSARAVEVLGRVLPVLKRDQKLPSTERVIRNVTLFGGIAQKIALLSEFEVNDFQLADVAVQLAFFQEIFDIIRRDQFSEVNQLVPALVRADEMVPRELWAEYVLVLIDQSGSQAYNSAPAARRALIRLADDVARAGLEALTPEVVHQYGHERWTLAKELASKYQHLLNGAAATTANDLATMSWKAFSEKYFDD